MAGSVNHPADENCGVANNLVREIPRVKRVTLDIPYFEKNAAASASKSHCAMHAAGSDGNFCTIRSTERDPSPH